jgi:MYXO-CTERM domain-containing protein
MLPSKSLAAAWLTPLAVLLLASASPAQAPPSIGLNFSGSQTTGTAHDLAPTESAGVVPQTNWNNILNPLQTPAMGDTTNVTGPMAGVVVNSAGAATAVTFTFSASNSWSVSTANTTGDAQLHNGYLDSTNDPVPNNPTTVTVNNLPFTVPYTVYAYVGSDGNGRSGHATVGNQTFYYLTNTNPFGGHVQATATDLASAANATYVQFDNVTGSSFTLTNIRDSNNVGLHAIQIVPVPEPTSQLLAASFALGGLAAWRRRRRATG